MLHRLTLRAQVALLAVAAVLVGVWFTITGPPIPYTGAAHGVKAHAAVGFSQVLNRVGAPVYVRCNFGGDSSADYRTLGRWDGYLTEGTGINSDSRTVCPGDVDQFRSRDDARCIKYTGPGYTDGYYKISANYWYKISDLAEVRVYSFYSGSPDYCAGRPYFRHDGPGGITP